LKIFDAKLELMLMISLFKSVVLPRWYWKWLTKQEKKIKKSTCAAQHVFGTEMNVMLYDRDSPNVPRC